jgi:hypothetical protein
MVVSRQSTLARFDLTTRNFTCRTPSNETLLGSEFTNTIGREEETGDIGFYWQSLVRHTCYLAGPVVVFKVTCHDLYLHAYMSVQ